MKQPNAKQRRSDELTLYMLRLRTDGMKPTAIGLRVGSQSQFVSTATNRIRSWDHKESGEASEVINAGYWA